MIKKLIFVYSKIGLTYNNVYKVFIKNYIIRSIDGNKNKLL